MPFLIPILSTIGSAAGTVGSALAGAGSAAGSALGGLGGSALGGLEGLGSSALGGLESAGSGLSNALLGSPGGGALPSGLAGPAAPGAGLFGGGGSFSLGAPGSQFLLRNLLGSIGQQRGSPVGGLAAGLGGRITADPRFGTGGFGGLDILRGAGAFQPRQAVVASPELPFTPSKTLLGSLFAGI